MSLSIENEDSSRLASELAELTGETKAEAVTVAIKERLERERDIQKRLQAMRAISKRFAESLRDGPSAVEHGAYLYDKRGLPEARP